MWARSLCLRNTLMRVYTVHGKRRWNDLRHMKVSTIVFYTKKKICMGGHCIRIQTSEASQSICAPVCSGAWLPVRLANKNITGAESRSIFSFFLSFSIALSLSLFLSLSLSLSLRLSLSLCRSLSLSLYLSLSISLSLSLSIYLFLFLFLYLLYQTLVLIVSTLYP